MKVRSHDKTSLANVNKTKLKKKKQRKENILAHVMGSISVIAGAALPTELF